VNYSVFLIVALIAEQVEGLIVVELIPDRARSEKLILRCDDAVTSAAVVVERIWTSGALQARTSLEKFLAYQTCNLSDQFVLDVSRPEHFRNIYSKEQG